MADSRIEQYRDLLRQLPNGVIDPHLPPGPDDEISELGKAILELAGRLAERFERERLLASVTEKIVQAMYLEEVLDFVYESFKPLIPYDRMGCALLERDGQWVRARWERSDSPEVHLRAGFAAPMAGSSLQDIIESGRPRIINDLRGYLRGHPASLATSLIVAEGVRSSLTCPLIALGRPVGFLFFSSRRAHCYEELHQDIFLRLSGLVSSVVEKSRLYQELVQLNRDLTQARDALRVQATHDALTGVWNRGAVMEAYGKSFDQTCRQGIYLSVVLVDIDLFKEVNDRHGHQAGDAVIRGVAGRIEQAARHGDYVGRYGGEEFLMVLNDCDGAGALAVAERVRQAVHAQPVAWEGCDIRVTVSIGVATLSCGDSELTPAQLIKRADDALYTAKRGGRDQVVAALDPSP